ncbi:MAG: hypothetical protein AB7R89_28660 [Dehalococcoidia bacterium]
MELTRVYSLEDLAVLYLEELGLAVPPWMRQADQVDQFVPPAAPEPLLFPDLAPPSPPRRPRVRHRQCPREGCRGVLLRDPDAPERFPVLYRLACGRRFAAEEHVAAITWPSMPGEEDERRRRREPSVHGQRL